MKFTKISILLVCLSAMLTSCASSKLAQVPQTRENFNQAIDTSENEQFLLNIIRMHNGQSPFFIGVDGVTTQSTLRTRVDGQLFNGTPPAPSTGPFWNVGPTVEITEAPTITFSPLQGSKFVSSMMIPLDASRIAMLRGSGWTLPDVLRLTVNRIGVLDNSVASRHVVDAAGLNENVAFDNFINGLSELNNTGKIEVSMTMYNGMPATLIHATDKSSGDNLSKLANLKGNYNDFILSQHTASSLNNPENVINIQTRSFLGIMNYISHGVHDNGSDKSTSNDVNQFNVFTSSSEPSNVTVKVNYNGKWYYIANDDAKSKATLVLLKLLYSLQVGDIKANLPIVTIPVR